MKSHFLIIFAILIIISNFTYAQEFTILGAGTRARSMGGAYAGIADDVTAIFWNPAGLLQMEKIGSSAGYSYEDYRISPQSDSLLKPWNSYNHIFNFLGGVIPLNEKWVIGLGYFKVMDYYSKYNSDEFKFKKERKCNVHAISPAFGFQPIKNFSLGATIDIFWGGKEFIFANKTFNDVSGDTTTEVSYFDINLKVGFLYYQINQYSLGIVFKCPLGLNKKHNAKDYNEIVYMPFIMSLGGSVHCFKNLILSADCEMKVYSELYQKYKKAVGYHNSDKRDHLFQFRLGSEYKIPLGKSIFMPIRVGMATNPTIFRDMDNERIMGAIYTGGLGVMKEKKCGIDFGVEYCRFKYYIPENGEYTEHYLRTLASITVLF